MAQRLQRDSLIEGNGANRVVLISCYWHRYCLSLCVIQRSEPKPVATLQRPLCVGGLRKSIGRTLHDDTGAGDDGLTAFLNARGRLIGIAYRILKNAAEVEDIVQEVWIRWQMTDRGAVRDAAAFLATTTM